MAYPDTENTQPRDYGTEKFLCFFLFPPPRFAKSGHEEGGRPCWNIRHLSECGVGTAAAEVSDGGGQFVSPSLKPLFCLLSFEKTDFGRLRREIGLGLSGYGCVPG